MIFLDQSGKRWRRIKRSTVAITASGVTAVAVLVGGSMAYHPQWGALPYVSRVVSAAVASTAKTLSGNQAAKPTAVKTSQTGLVAVKKPTGATLGAATSTVTASPSPSATPTPSPTPTPTRPQTVSPTGGNPVQNDKGLSHKP